MISTRLLWIDVPIVVRSWVEDQIGTVVKIIPADGGYTPGFAGCLVAENGETFFVKIGENTSSYALGDAYAQEIKISDLLPLGSWRPVTMYCTWLDGWFVLIRKYVEAQQPSRPWSLEQVTLVCDSFVGIAEELSASALKLPTFQESFSKELNLWDIVLSEERYETLLPGLKLRGTQAQKLAQKAIANIEPETVVHGDLRDDNMLITTSNEVVIIDWNWAFLGEKWMDLATLFISMYMDGIDVLDYLTNHPLFQNAEPDHVDGFYAMLVAYWIVSSQKPLHENQNAQVREMQKLYALTSWDLLAKRRGWVL